MITREPDTDLLNVKSGELEDGGSGLLVFALVGAEPARLVARRHSSGSGVDVDGIEPGAGEVREYGFGVGAESGFAYDGGGERAAARQGVDNVVRAEAHERIPVAVGEGSEVLAHHLGALFIFRTQDAAGMERGGDGGEQRVEIERLGHDEGEAGSIWSCCYRLPGGEDRDRRRSGALQECQGRGKGGVLVVGQEVGQDEIEGAMVNQVVRFLERCGLTRLVPFIVEEEDERLADSWIIFNQQDL